MSVAPPLDLSKARLSVSAVDGLGQYTKTKAATLAASRAASKVARFRLQEGGKRLMPHERVARCLRWLRGGETAVEILHSASEGAAHYSRLEVCGSVWLCAVCAAKVAEERRKELRQAVEHCAVNGGGVLHLTFTVRHNRGDDLAGLLEGFTKAYSRMMGHWTYRKLIGPTYQIMGAVRSLEVTHGINGWHPHHHVLMFVGRPLTDDEMRRLENEMYALWEKSAAREKLSMNRAGLTVQGARAAAGYVAKWGAEEELTKSHMKSGRGDASSPWDLLRRFLDGDDRAGRLWQEYGKVFKGRRQLVWSAGLRALLGLEDETPDGQAAAALPNDAKHLGWVAFSDWLLVLRWQLRGELLNLAAAGDWSVVADFLAELRARRLADRRARGLVVDLPDVPPPPRQLVLGLSGFGLSAELHG